MYPVTTGGSTSGRWITPSSRPFPGNRVREEDPCRTDSRGRLPATAHMDTCRLSRKASHSRGVRAKRSIIEG